MKNGHCFYPYHFLFIFLPSIFCLEWLPALLWQLLLEKERYS